MDLSADLAMFYADFGVPVVYTPKGGVAAAPQMAILDQPGMTVIGGEILATDYSLRYPVSTFPAVKRGDGFSIGGVSYTARESAQSASVDGLEHIVPLAKG